MKPTIRQTNNIWGQTSATTNANKKVREHNLEKKWTWNGYTIWV